MNSIQKWNEINSFVTPFLLYNLAIHLSFNRIYPNHQNVWRHNAMYSWFLDLRRTFVVLFCAQIPDCSKPQYCYRKSPLYASPPLARRHTTKKSRTIRVRGSPFRCHAAWVCVRNACVPESSATLHSRYIWGSRGD